MHLKFKIIYAIFPFSQFHTLFNINTNTNTNTKIKIKRSKVSKNNISLKFIKIQKMGTQQSNHEARRTLLAPPLDDYTCRLSTPKYHLWEHLYQRESLIEIPVAIHNQAQAEKLVESFWMRHRHHLLVSTQYFEQVNNGLTARVFYERVFTNMSRIKDIPFADSLQFFYVGLKGFEILYQKFGFFQIQEEMFHLTDKKKVKIWLHRSLSRIQPVKPSRMGSESDMVKRVIQLINENIDHQINNDFPIGSALYQGADSFKNAIAKLRDICRGNNLIIPQKIMCMESICVGKMGDMLDQYSGAPLPEEQQQEKEIEQEYEQNKNQEQPNNYISNLTQKPSSPQKKISEENQLSRNIFNNIQRSQANSNNNNNNIRNTSNTSSKRGKGIQLVNRSSSISSQKGSRTRSSQENVRPIIRANSMNTVQHHHHVKIQSPIKNLDSSGRSRDSPKLQLQLQYQPQIQHQQQQQPPPLHHQSQPQFYPSPPPQLQFAPQQAPIQLKNNHNIPQKVGHPSIVFQRNNSPSPPHYNQRPLPMQSSCQNFNPRPNNRPGTPHSQSSQKSQYQINVREPFSNHPGGNRSEFQGNNTSINKNNYPPSSHQINQRSNLKIVQAPLPPQRPPLRVQINTEPSNHHQKYSEFSPPHHHRHQQVKKYSETATNFIAPSLAKHQRTNSNSFLTISPQKQNLTKIQSSNQQNISSPNFNKIAQRRSRTGFEEYVRNFKYQKASNTISISHNKEKDKISSSLLKKYSIDKKLQQFSNKESQVISSSKNTNGNGEGTQKLGFFKTNLYQINTIASHEGSEIIQDGSNRRLKQLPSQPVFPSVTDISDNYSCLNPDHSNLQAEKHWKQEESLVTKLDPNNLNIKQYREREYKPNIDEDIWSDVMALRKRKQENKVY